MALMADAGKITLTLMPVLLVLARDLSAEELDTLTGAFGALYAVKGEPIPVTVLLDLTGAVEVHGDDN
jgi:hypothetical protein